MSDHRIHLIIQYIDNLLYTVQIQFPSKDVLNYFTEENLKGYEALVRSLAALDSHDLYEHHCRECGFSLEDEIELMRHCPLCHEHLTTWKLNKRVFDTKLKVTFGSGTYVDKFVRETTGTISPIECEYTKREIIEPLQPIEAVCKELGVEYTFE